MNWLEWIRKEIIDTCETRVVAFGLRQGGRIGCTASWWQGAHRDYTGVGEGQTPDEAFADAFAKIEAKRIALEGREDEAGDVPMIGGRK